MSEFSSTATAVAAETRPRWKQSLEAHWRTDGNSTCADCSTPLNAGNAWASVYNKVLICTSCSGVHRSLGVDFSFVQSLSLDEWNEDMVNDLTKGLRAVTVDGRASSSTEEYSHTNIEANAVLEFHVPPEFRKPVHSSARTVREKYINAKYKDRLFTSEICGSDKPLSPINDASSDEKSASIGEIEFRGMLMIHLKSAKNLVNADTFDLSDPYVTMELGRQKQKSKVIQDSLNPKWNERLSFSWSGDWKDMISISVWDKDAVGKDDLLGDVKINIVKEVFKVSDSSAYAAFQDLKSTTEPVALDLSLQNIAHGSIQLSIEYIHLA
jgi:hypothetical protein